MEREAERRDEGQAVGPGGRRALSRWQGAKSTYDDVRPGGTSTRGNACPIVAFQQKLDGCLSLIS